MGKAYSKKVKLVLVAPMLFALVACIESEEILMVKKGSMIACPNYTVEKMVNSFMANPEWEHIVADNDIDYVNISGIITVYGTPAKGLLQLWVRNDDFGFQAFEIDGEPQSGYMASALISKMCESAKTSVKKPNSNEKKYGVHD